jgi:hypothetical protein
VGCQKEITDKSEKVDRFQEAPRSQSRKATKKKVQKKEKAALIDKFSCQRMTTKLTELGKSYPLYCNTSWLWKAV